MNIYETWLDMTCLYMNVYETWLMHVRDVCEVTRSYGRRWEKRQSQDNLNCRSSCPFCSTVYETWLVCTWVYARRDSLYTKDASLTCTRQRTCLVNMYVCETWLVNIYETWIHTRHDSFVYEYIRDMTRCIRDMTRLYINIYETWLVVYETWLDCTYEWGMSHIWMRHVYETWLVCTSLVHDTRHDSCMCGNACHMTSSHVQHSR